jgi:hypothetical protein
VQQLLVDLAQFDNALHVVVNLLWPHLQETMAAMQSAQDLDDSDPLSQTVPAFNYVRPPSLSELMKTPPYPTVLEAMRRAGFAVQR